MLHISQIICVKRGFFQGKQTGFQHFDFTHLSWGFGRYYSKVGALFTEIVYIAILINNYVAACPDCCSELEENYPGYYPVAFVFFLPSSAYAMATAAPVIVLYSFNAAEYCSHWPGLLYFFYGLCRYGCLYKIQGFVVGL